MAHGQGSKIIFLNSVLEKEHELNLFYYRGKNPFKFAKLFIGFFENVDIFTGRERDAIFMHFAEGKSIAEIARLLHTSRTRVNTIIKHASDKLLQKTRYLFSQMKVENSYQQKYEDLKINYDIVCNQFNQLLAKSGSDENIDFLKTRIVDYNLSIRCLNALRAAGIETIADLLSFSEEQLIRYRNFGKISLLEVKEFLKKHGFELRVYSEK